MKVIQLAAAMVIIRLVCDFLVVERVYATPVVLAVILCFFTVEIAGVLQRPKFKSVQIPHGLALTLAVGILGSLCGVIGWILNANIHAIIAVAPAYQQKLLAMLESLRTISIFKNLPTDYRQLAASLDLKELFKSLAELVKVFAENIIAIVLYSGFILSCCRPLVEDIKEMINEYVSEDMFEEINSKIRTYVVVKSLLNSLAALLAYGVMTAFGLNFAPLWALLIFLLHFVPIIGGIVSFALPLSIALVQFGWHQEFFVLLVALSTIMLVVGHVLEPRMMGESLNLKPLIIIVTLGISNQIWGMIGMLLCIPILVIFKIILAEFPEARPLVNLISVKREVEKE